MKKIKQFKLSLGNNDTTRNNLPASNSSLPLSSSDHDQLHNNVEEISQNRSNRRERTQAAMMKLYGHEDLSKLSSEAVMEHFSFEEVGNSARHALLPSLHPIAAPIGSFHDIFRDTSDNRHIQAIDTMLGMFVQRAHNKSIERQNNAKYDSVNEMYDRCINSCSIENPPMHFATALFIGTTYIQPKYGKVPKSNFGIKQVNDSHSPFTSEKSFEIHNKIMDERRGENKPEVIKNLKKERTRSREIGRLYPGVTASAAALDAVRIGLCIKKCVVTKKGDQYIDKAAHRLQVEKDKLILDFGKDQGPDALEHNTNDTGTIRNE